MVKAKVYIYNKPFDGLPKEGDLKLIEEELPPVQNGQFLAEAVYLSVDPYHRAYANALQVGAPFFIGAQVAKVVESKNPEYSVGTYVVGEFGWRTHTITDGSATVPGFLKAWKIPNPQDFPLSLSLGVLGMPGNTAYFGFLEICKPKAGETVIVTGAAGAVGSIVGQIAKIKGCTVIGVAGSDKKGKWLVDELGFDHFVNYKDPAFDKTLTKIAPNGIDCYFDNVGGEISSIILSHMKLFGRISVCGAISAYNNPNGVVPKATVIQGSMVSQQLKMEGFAFLRWAKQWNEGIKQNRQWVKEGKLKYQETVTEGFEKMFTAFVNMLQGGNTGKAIIKV